MKNLRTISLAILAAMMLLNFAACKNETANKTATSTPATTPTPAVETKITVGTFSEFPPEIDGCSCYFSQSEADFKAKKYIYVDNYENAAFVNINGTMVKVTRPDAKSEKSTNEKHVIKTFSNADYEVIVDINQVKHVDEVWSYTGTLTIKPKTGAATTINIQGECGC